MVLVRNFFRELMELVRAIILYLTDPVSFFMGFAEKKKGLKKNLLIARVDLIGDFVLWLNAARAIRVMYPPDQYSITLIGNEIWCQLAIDVGCFDTVIPVNRNKLFKHFRYRHGILSAVRAARYDIAINPSFSREFLLGDSIIRASRAPVKIGSDGDLSNIRPWQKSISDRWYNRLIGAGDGLMELERNAEFVRGLGLSDFRAGLPELPDTRNYPPGFYARNYFVVFPGASYAAKRWPVGRFAELVRNVCHASDWTCVLCGGTGEEWLGESIEKEAAAKLENWIGRTTLQELVGIIAGAHLVITNDTSAVHIAAALGTRVVCIVGGGQPGRFLPYRTETVSDRPLPIVVQNIMPCSGCNWKCEKTNSIHRIAPCIEHITVAEVWRAVENIMEQHSSPKEQ